MDVDIESQVSSHGRGNNTQPDNAPGMLGGESEEKPTRTSQRSQSLHTSQRHSADINTARAASVVSSSEINGNSPYDDEEVGLFDFAEELRRENPPGEPWFMEMSRLRRMHFLWLNRELAAVRKIILEERRASDADMKMLQGLLRDQAEAIRDYQYIKSLDFLNAGHMERRHSQSILYFPPTAKSDHGIDPFRTESYRCLPNTTFSGGIRELIRIWFPSRFTWTKAEREAKPDLYRMGYAPTTLAPRFDQLARLTIPIVGALFILVPMYIMALYQTKANSLVTTTVAVLLFVVLCSVSLRTSNDQTLAITAGYAAVLTVFVGLTSDDGGQQSSS